MNIDLGSQTLDVVFALAFLFFLLSLIVSALSELMAWIFSLRHEFLKKGIKGLLGDSFGHEVLSHPLVKSDIREGKAKKFSYVSSRNFALALVDILNTPRASNGLPATLEGKIDARVEGEPKRQLQALRKFAPGYSVTHFRDAVERWFDESMERVSGWYRRWSQVITCVIALAVAVGLNVDALRVADRLGNDEAVLGAVVKAGDAYLDAVQTELAAQKAKEEAAEKEAGAEAQGAGGKDVAGGEAGKATGGATVLAGKPISPSVAGNVIQRQVDEVSALSLPIGWEDDFSPNLSTVVGWLITAIAISLGAPFWFDALSRIARLRTTGEKPGTSPA